MGRHPGAAALAIAALAWTWATPAAGASQEPDYRIRLLATEHPSSVSPLIWVTLVNSAYSPLNLLDKIKASQLLVDGKPAFRAEQPFKGPPGVPGQGSWSGCLPLSAYEPPVPPGKHRFALRLGTSVSNEVAAAVAPPVHWRQGTLKTRLKEVQDMADALVPGLPRSCVEEWLTVLDGGIQGEREARYFLEPGIKVVVPYSHGHSPDQHDDTVSGTVRVYQEPFLTD